MNINKIWHVVIDECKQIFLSKHSDYGSTWRWYRPSSLRSKILIKMLRSRRIEDGMEQQVTGAENSLLSEYQAVINYAVLALVQYQIESSQDEKSFELTKEDVQGLYETEVIAAYNLMLIKNHDYDDAWKKMEPKTITDEILVKLARTVSMQKVDTDENTRNAIIENYLDIINYAVFYIVLSEPKN